MSYCSNLFLSFKKIKIDALPNGFSVGMVVCRTFAGCSRSATAKTTTMGFHDAGSMTMTSFSNDSGKYSYSSLFFASFLLFT